MIVEPTCTSAVVWPVVTGPAKLADVIHRVDLELRQEALRFRLAFSCERCVSFEADEGGCALGYPNSAHAGVNLELVDEVVFCKAFELA